MKIGCSLFRSKPSYAADKPYRRTPHSVSLCCSQSQALCTKLRLSGPKSTVIT